MQIYSPHLVVTPKIDKLW